MWSFRRREDPAERRHRETLGLEKEAVTLTQRTVELSERAIELAKDNRTFQIVGTVIALSALMATLLLAFHPWSRAAILKAQIVLADSQGNAVVPQSVSSLPSPPPYSNAESGDHCGVWWKRWFPAQDAAVAFSGPSLKISAPRNADVAVTSARVAVYRSYTPASLTFVACKLGGPEAGTKLSVDLANPTATPTIVAADGRDVPLSIPDAVINIDPGHTDYVTVSAIGASRIYEWSLELQCVVDQHPQTVTFGSGRQPLRTWLGRRPLPPYEYDWQTSSWERVPQHGSVP